MRKNRFCALALAALSLCILCACAAENAPAQQAPAPASEPAAPAAQDAKSGFALAQPISAGELDARIAEGKECVVYFQGKKSSENEEILQKKLRTVTEEYASLLLCDYYTIPIADYKGAKDILGGNLFGLVLFKDGEANVLSGDSRSDAGSAFNRFFEYELLQPNDHGLPILSYDEVMKKIEGGEAFILYIGRDTCPQCRLFTPNLEKGLIDKGLKTPIYYFYVQSYYSAQERNEAGAEETWNNAVASIGFQGTPAMLYFKDGVGVTFDFFNNLFPEDAKSQEEFDESNRLCLTALDGWLKENNIE